MPWYFYSGRVPVPVKRTDGIVISVAPRGYVETDPKHVRKFGAKMRRCAAPRIEIEKAALTPPTTIAPPTKSSPLSSTVTERGVTRDPGTPPKPMVAVEDKKSEDAPVEAPKRRSRSRKKPKSEEATGDTGE
jgi:hypothetical protein